MKPPPGKLPWTVWAGLGLTIALVALAFLLSKLPAWRNPISERLPVYSQIAPFTLTNQFARTVTLGNLTGQVWVADIIFTRCPGPCARMTRQMAELQTRLPADPRVKLISLTTDPDFDHPEVLKRYAERFGAQSGRWDFLTGTKAELDRLAVDGLKFTAMEKKPEERESATDLFIHSTIFALVDKHGQLRAVFQTQPPEPDENEPASLKVPPDNEWPEMRTRILSAVKSLLAED